MKKCTQCGQILSDDIRFCYTCGGGNFETTTDTGTEQPPSFQQSPTPSYYQQSPQQPSQPSYYQAPGQQPPQQSYYQAPGQQPYYQPAGGAYQAGPTNPARGQAIASMVLGILSLVGGYIPIVQYFCLASAIIGLILGISARKKLAPNEGRGMATAGMICSIVALASTLIVIIACAICVSSISGLGTTYGMFS